MKLKEFLELFSHNNMIRLLYKYKGGHIPCEGTWSSVSMDHEIIAGTKFKAFCDFEVVGLAGIIVDNFPDAINIVLQRCED